MNSPGHQISPCWWDASDWVPRISGESLNFGEKFERSRSSLILFPSVFLTTKKFRMWPGRFTLVNPMNVFIHLFHFYSSFIIQLLLFYLYVVSFFYVCFSDTLWNVHLLFATFFEVGKGVTIPPTCISSSPTYWSFYSLLTFVSYFLQRQGQDSLT